jgi:hypothetical protein
MERIKQNPQLIQLYESIKFQEFNNSTSDTASLYLRVKNISDQYKQTEYSQQIPFEKILQIPFRRQPLSQSQLNFHHLIETPTHEFQIWANKAKNEYLYALPKSYLLKIYYLTQLADPQLLSQITDSPKIQEANQLLTQTKFALIVSSFPKKYLIQRMLAEYIQSTSLEDYQVEYLTKRLKEEKKCITPKNIDTFIDLLDTSLADKHSINFRKIKVPYLSPTKEQKHQKPFPSEK